jgi:hypothetical protein
MDESKLLIAINQAAYEADARLENSTKAIELVQSFTSNNAIGFANWIVLDGWQFHVKTWNLKQVTVNYVKVSTQERKSIEQLYTLYLETPLNSK